MDLFLSMRMSFPLPELQHTVLGLCCLQFIWIFSIYSPYSPNMGRLSSACIDSDPFLVVCSSHAPYYAWSLIPQTRHLSLRDTCKLWYSALDHLSGWWFNPHRLWHSMHPPHCAWAPTSHTKLPTCMHGHPLYALGFQLPGLGSLPYLSPFQPLWAWIAYTNPLHKLTCLVSDPLNRPFPNVEAILTWLKFQIPMQVQPPPMTPSLPSWDSTAIIRYTPHSAWAHSLTLGHHGNPLFTKPVHLTWRVPNS